MAHACFSSRCPVRAPTEWNAPGSPGCTHYSSSHPAKATRYTQSIQGMSLHKNIPSTLEVPSLHNSQKETQKVKQNEEKEEYALTEQNKTSEKELNEMQISNQPHKKFTVMAIKKFTGCERRVDEPSENFNRERKYKKNQSHLKNITNEKYIRGNQQQIKR